MDERKLLSKGRELKFGSVMLKFSRKVRPIFKEGNLE